MTEAASPTDKRPIIVAIYNQKGGVGKTTSAINLATTLAAVERKVLVIDLDAQANATSSLCSEDVELVSGFDLIAEEAGPPPPPGPSRFPGIEVYASTEELLGADVELNAGGGKLDLLSRRLRQVPADVDFVVIDCPPALGFLAVNALVAAHVILMPVTPDTYAFDGLKSAWGAIERIRARRRPDMAEPSILITNVTPGDAVDKRMEDLIRDAFGGHCMETVVPKDGAIRAANLRGVPVTVFDATTPASTAYVRVTLEFFTAASMFDLDQKQYAQLDRISRGLLDWSLEMRSKQLDPLVDDRQAAPVLVSPPPPPRPPPAMMQISLGIVAALMTLVVLGVVAAGLWIGDEPPPFDPVVADETSPEPPPETVDLGVEADAEAGMPAEASSSQ